MRNKIYFKEVMKMKYITNIILALAVKTALALFVWSISSFIWAEHSYVDADEVVKETTVEPAKIEKTKVVILNNQNQQVQQKTDTNQMSLQPVVHVTDSPISKTYATELRKSRQDAEVQTEQKIVEKLESARLRDEQERYNRLFGNKVKKQSSIIVADASRQTVVAPISDIHASTVLSKETDNDSIYIGLIGGQIANLNQQVVNLNSFGSFGFSFGAKDDSGLIIEGSFYYSRHVLTPMNNLFQNSWFQNNSLNYNSAFSSNVNQLTGVFSILYSPVSSRVQPYAGVSAAYNLWMYNHNNTFNPINSMNFNCHVGYQFCAAGGYRTNSIDIGLSAGMDLKLNDKIDVGFNLLLNVLNVYNNHSRMYNNYYLNSRYYGANGLFTATTPISLEETNWVIASINAKFHF